MGGLGQDLHSNSLALYNTLTLLLVERSRTLLLPVELIYTSHSIEHQARQP